MRATIQYYYTLLYLLSFWIVSSVKSQKLRIPGNGEGTFRRSREPPSPEKDDRPWRAREMYKEMCDKSDDQNRNACMCDFLATMKPPEADMPSLRGTAIDCINGVIESGADEYPCLETRLLSIVGVAELSGEATSTEEGSDCWGWTSPVTQQEIAIIGFESFVAFVDVTDPLQPVILGRLATPGTPTFWKDIKTYGDYAYIVSENTGSGLQVIDMTRLLSLDLSNGPVDLTADFHTTTFFSKAHNLFIHEETGFAYVVGSDHCGQGMVILNLLGNPAAPTFVGCFDDDGYVHDVQCVLYHGADADYQGQEICFACNIDTVTIIDVTDKSDMVILSRTSYARAAYTHQGWLTADHNIFFFGDEADEGGGSNTRTLVLGVEDLVNPTLVGEFLGPDQSIDHNMYTVGNTAVVQANYASGLQVYAIGENIAVEPNLTLVAHFDSYPPSNSAGFVGAWSSYIYFPSGNIIISDLNRGLITVEVTADLGARTNQPSAVPSSLPSTSPSTTPPSLPSAYPSQFPSSIPSTSPSTTPSDSPVMMPSSVPSTEPPTSVPSTEPSTSAPLSPTGPCPAADACTRPGGRRPGYYLNRRVFFGRRCISRCVSESFVPLRLRSRSWNCGQC